MHCHKRREDGHAASQALLAQSDIFQVQPGQPHRITNADQKAAVFMLLQGAANSICGHKGIRVPSPSITVAVVVRPGAAGRQRSRSSRRRGSGCSSGRARNSKRSVDVRFGAHSGLNSDTTALPKSAPLAELSSRKGAHSFQRQVLPLNSNRSALVDQLLTGTSTRPLRSGDGLERNNLIEGALKQHPAPRFRGLMNGISDDRLCIRPVIRGGAKFERPERSSSIGRVILSRSHFRLRRRRRKFLKSVAMKECV